MFQQKSILNDVSDYRLIFETSDRIPDVSAEFRRSITNGPRTKEAYLKGSNETPALWSVELSQPDNPIDQEDAVKIAFWNLERCKYLDATAVRLASVRADVNLLCELDVGMARSDQRNTSRELAGRLKQGYAFGVEYIELGLGDASERSIHEGEENQLGLHGNAILSNMKLKNVALVRLDADGFWFLHSKHERRLGGRIAIISTISVADTDIVVVSTHFESLGTPESRALEMKKLLAALQEYCQDNAPVLIAGDLNTNTAQRDEIFDPAKRVEFLDADPNRLKEPEAYEPMFEIAKKAGFCWARCNAEGTTQRPHCGDRFERKLDWIFTRGLQAWDPQIIPVADGKDVVVSDHDMLTVMVKPVGAL